MVDWGDNYMAPSKEQRIAAHRAPTVRDTVRMAVRFYGATWHYNRRLWAQFTLGIAGAAFMAAFVLSLIISLVF